MYILNMSVLKYSRSSKRRASGIWRAVTPGSRHPPHRVRAKSEHLKTFALTPKAGIWP